MPAFLPNSLYNRVDVRNRVLYFTEHDPGQPTYVFRITMTDTGNTGVEQVITWPLDHPDGELYIISNAWVRRWRDGATDQFTIAGGGEFYPSGSYSADARRFSVKEARGQSEDWRRRA
jgi:hypothetical protein